MGSGYKWEWKNGEPYECNSEPLSVLRNFGMGSRNYTQQRKRVVAEILAPIFVFTNIHMFLYIF